MLLAKDTGKLVTLVLTAAVLAIFVVEVAAWSIYGPPGGRRHKKVFCRPDPQLGWALRAGTHALHIAEE